MKLKPETVGFTRGGALYLEPPHRWRSWQRDVWTCCSRSPELLAATRLSPIEPARPITISTPSSAPDGPSHPFSDMLPF